MDGKDQNAFGQQVHEVGQQPEDVHGSSVVWSSVQAVEANACGEKGGRDGAAMEAAVDAMRGRAERWDVRERVRGAATGGCTSPCCSLEHRTEHGHGSSDDTAARRLERPRYSTRRREAGAVPCCSP